MQNGQQFQIKCLGQIFDVTVDDENLEESFGFWTDQELEKLEACNNAFIEYARTIGLIIDA